MKSAFLAAHGPKCLYIDRFVDSTCFLGHFAHVDVDYEGEILIPVFTGPDLHITWCPHTVVAFPCHSYSACYVVVGFVTTSSLRGPRRRQTGSILGEPWCGPSLSVNALSQ